MIGIARHRSGGDFRWERSSRHRPVRGPIERPGGCTGGVIADSSESQPGVCSMRICGLAKQRNGEGRFNRTTGEKNRDLPPIGHDSYPAWSYSDFTWTRQRTLPSADPCRRRLSKHNSLSLESAPPVSTTDNMTVATCNLLIMKSTAALLYKLR